MKWIITNFVPHVIFKNMKTNMKNEDLFVGIAIIKRKENFISKKQSPNNNKDVMYKSNNNRTLINGF